MTFEQFTTMFAAMDAASLKAMLERRHPDYVAKLAHWNFLDSTYDGGRAWFQSNIFKYHKEGDKEFAERKERAYRFNHTREVVDLVNKYIFKAQINRRVDDAPKFMSKFWKSSTLRSLRIEEFMKLVSAKASIYGKIWVVVDSSKVVAGGTVAEDDENGDRVYAYVVKPQNLLDMAFTKDGQLLWAIIRESIRDDSSPSSSGSTKVQYRIWNKDFWALFGETINTKTKEKEYELLNTGEHGVGMIPVFPVDHVIDEDYYSGQSLIDDAAYLDRAVANYLSNLDAIIQDQTFSQLVIPAQAMLPGDDGHEKIMEMGTKRVFTYDGQANIAPTYISPDPSQAGIILSVVEKIISEIYHSTGLAGERTKQDNSMGIDNSSGVAKAYDFDKMNAMLASKANALEQAEENLLKIVAAYNSETYEAPDRPYVEYPKDFDVRGLYDEFEIAQRLALVGAPKMLRREQMKAVADKLFPTLKNSILVKVKAEIDADWLEITEEMLATPGTPPVPPVEENQQGQNNG
jgi:hypothetical protein